MACKIYNTRQPVKVKSGNSHKTLKSARSRVQESAEPEIVVAAAELGHAAQGSGNGRNNSLDNSLDNSLSHNPIIARWTNAICRRCLQVHAAPLDGHRTPGNKMWWCTARPVSGRQRNKFFNNLAWLDAEAVVPAAGSGSVGVVRAWAERQKFDHDEAIINYKLERGRRDLVCRARQRRRAAAASSAAASAPGAAHAAVKFRDDPVEEGVAIARDYDMQLPSNRASSSPSNNNHNGIYLPSGERFLDVDTMLTMDDIQHEEPVFVIKTVTRRRRGRDYGEAPSEVESLCGKGGAGRVTSDEEEYEFIYDDEEGDDVMSVAEWDELK